jgi:hypothetical protein
MSDNGPVTRTFHGHVVQGCLIVVGDGTLAAAACAGVFAPPPFLLPFEHGNLVVHDALP